MNESDSQRESVDACGVVGGNAGDRNPVVFLFVFHQVFFFLLYSKVLKIRLEKSKISNLLRHSSTYYDRVITQGTDINHTYKKSQPATHYTLVTSVFTLMAQDFSFVRATFKKM